MGARGNGLKLVRAPRKSFPAQTRFPLRRFSAPLRASVEKNGLMSRFFALFWQNFASLEPLKKAAMRVPADIRILTIEISLIFDILFDISAFFSTPEAREECFHPRPRASRVSFAASFLTSTRLTRSAPLSPAAQRPPPHLRETVRAREGL